MSPATRNLAPKYPPGAGPAVELPAGKAGRTWLAVRTCGRCLGRYPHPLAVGWAVDATEDGQLLQVGPCCTRAGDLDVNGKEVAASARGG